MRMLSLLFSVNSQSLPVVEEDVSRMGVMHVLSSRSTLRVLAVLSARGAAIGERRGEERCLIEGEGGTVQLRVPAPPFPLWVPFFCVPLSDLECFAEDVPEDTTRAMPLDDL